MQWTATTQGWFEQLLAGVTEATVAAASSAAAEAAALATQALVDPEVGAIEEHIHNRERWHGNGGATLTAWQIDSGNNAFGAWVQILLAGDTPKIAGMTKFDARRLLITATERDGPYRIQIAWGASGPAGLAAGDYTELMFSGSAVASQRRGPLEIIMPRLPAGSQLFARCWVVDNTGTLDFFLGLHEYDH